MPTYRNAYGTVLPESVRKRASDRPRAVIKRGKRNALVLVGISDLFGNAQSGRFEIFENVFHFLSVLSAIIIM